MDTGLKGRVAIVAASSQGIARAAAEGLAREGANLALCARNQKNLDAAVSQLRDKHGAEVLAQVVDVTDPAAVRQFVAAVAQTYGRVDICVTNAGGPPAKDFLSLSIDDWRNAVELNFLSVVSFAREVIPLMQKQRWGRLITLTSVSVKQPIADLILSNAVRAAVVGLVKSLSNDFGKDGITVNNVGPGYTATDRLKSLAGTRAAAAGISADEILNRFGEATALKRVARPEEVADAIVWLASERASYVTGQTILVDGGAYKGL